MRIPFACLIGLAMLASESRAGGREDYVRDVKPLLAKHCVSCHGAERPKGGLRLDTAAQAIESRVGRPRQGQGEPAVTVRYRRG